MSKVLSSVSFLSLIFSLFVFTPALAFAADANVGNEVVDSADATLTRTGAGTAANPYKLQLNLSNSNTWLSPQIFNSGITVASVLNSSSISNSGNITAGGNIAVNGGSVTSTASSGALFNTTVTTLNIGGAATTLTLGATTGTATIQNGSISFPNATAFTASVANAAFNTVDLGGGYGSTGLSVASNGDLSTNGNVTVDGVSTLTGSVAVNGGVVTTTSTNVSLFNTTATGFSIGGAATSVTLGANGAGTTTIRNTTISFPNASSVNAASATAAFNTLNVGGGYGSTGFSAFTNGTIAANGDLIVDGNSTLTGNVTTSGDIAVNGADLTTTGTTASVFNTNATTLNLAGAATSMTLGANTGTATIRNGTLSLPNATAVNATNANLSVSSTTIGGGYGSTGITETSSGNLQMNGNLTVDGTSTLTGNVTASANLSLPSLSTATGTQLCLDGSNNVVKCTVIGGGLQTAYGDGNTITTTDGRNIIYTLSDTASDSGFVVTTATGATGYTLLQRADGAGTSAPNQLLLIDNADTDDTQPVGMKVQAASGGMTTAVDLSDTNIVTAIALGSNDVSGTNFSITGSTGNVTTSGDVSVNGGDVTTTSSTASIFNTNATTLNIGGAATTVSLGGVSGTTTVNHNLTVSGNTTANGDFTSNGASNFNPPGTNSVTVNTDSDSFLTITGLQTSSGDPLCIDASNNVVKCSASGSAMMAAPAQTTTTANSDITALQDTVKKQQDEIDLLKQEIEALKAKVQ